MKGKHKESKAKIINTAEIGRVKKMDRLYPDMINDCFRDVSTSGPNTKANITGAGGKPNLRMK